MVGIGFGINWMSKKVQNGAGEQSSGKKAKKKKKRDSEKITPACRMEHRMAWCTRYNIDV